MPRRANLRGTRAPSLWLPLVATVAAFWAGPPTEFGHEGSNLLPGESVELDNSGLWPKRRRHQLGRLITTVQLDDHPAAMYAIFAAPVCVRYKVRAKLLDRSKRLDSGVELIFV